MEVAIEKEDGIWIVTPRLDDLDASNSKEFKEKMAPVLKEGSKVVLDMGHVKFVDSSGLGAILSCLRKLNKGDGDLFLYGLNKPVQTLFELVRMNRVFKIYASKDEALKAYKG